MSEGSLGMARTPKGLEVREEHSFPSFLSQSPSEPGLGDAEDTGCSRQPSGLGPALRRLAVQKGGNDRAWAPWAPRPLTRLSQAQAQAQAPAPVLGAAPLPLHPPGHCRASVRAEPPIPECLSVLTCLLICVPFRSFPQGHLPFTIPAQEGRGIMILTLQREA